jgi:hypothetical protein
MSKLGIGSVKHIDDYKYVYILADDWRFVKRQIKTSLGKAHRLMFRVILVVRLMTSLSTIHQSQYFAEATIGATIS